MKKKTIIISIAIVLIILIIPFRTVLKDGGTKEYTSILYKITKVHRLNEASPTGYDEGTIIKFLGKEIYNNVIIHVNVKPLTKEDIIHEDSGLLFSISLMNSKCVPVQLSLYDDNKYVVYTSYETCKKGVPCNLILKYSGMKEGTYDYDVMQIIANSIDANNLSFNSDNTPDYEIYTGKDGHMYVTYQNNIYLKELLEKININLKTCAKPEYK